MEPRIPLAEAARMLGYGYQHAWNLAKAGDIPTIIDRRRRYVSTEWLRSKLPPEPATVSGNGHSIQEGG